MEKPSKHLSTPLGKRRLKQAGVLVFLFFLIKGLLWLIVPALLIYWGFDAGWLTGLFGGD